MKAFVAVAVALMVGLGLLSPGPARAQKQFVPSSTKVAILPTLNTSQEKDAKQRDAQREAVDKSLAEAFSSRGFVVLDAGVVQNAIASSKIDLADEENHKRATLFTIGRACGADVIVFVNITNVSQALHQNFWAANREGTASLKTWVLETEGEKAPLSAKVLSSKSGGSYFAGLDKGSSRIVRACANAVRQGLADYLKPYAVTKPTSDK